jgi:hypothetical protein
MAPICRIMLKKWLDSSQNWKVTICTQYLTALAARSGAA